MAESNSRAVGAGHELPAQMDMRFAGPKAHVGPTENGFGLFAGFGGQSFLGPLVIKGRAMSTHWLRRRSTDPRARQSAGFNQYHETPEGLTSVVNSLAQRIVLFPADGLNDTKTALSYLNPT